MPNNNLQQLLYEHGRLFGACLKAYRKHHLGDDSIGWEELSDELGTTLQEVMGDKGFQHMLDSNDALKTGQGRLV